MNKIKKSLFLTISNECIGCDTCTTIAPNYFEMNKQNTLAIVVKHPNKEFDVKQCMLALKKCPVNAIGARQ
ncbi:ferredoxin [Candidatus Marinamargulisbacteria bacterium SCGC AG-410-N11]|nr:ferredoxin [Candidatus Marinamargulisbacteria bacterium SCGC AG-410-N11]